MTENEAIEWIHSRLKFGIKPGLERMKWMLNQLGNPQNKIKGIHVVGTNGKGSTTSYLQHIFTQSGYHVGTFTSPYILDFKERISLDGQMIASADFTKLVSKVKPIVERLSLETQLEDATEFEVITVLMFEYFGHMHPVDIAIIEAGMGGLYDSTNVFTPLAVVCPSIGLDHQSVLGDSYTEIAEQKVGVIKENVPFFYQTNRDDVRQVFKTKGQMTNSELFELGEQVLISQDKTEFSVSFRNVTISHLKLQLLGFHQKQNAALAIATALYLTERFPNLNLKTIQQGVVATTWAGRTEFLSSNIMIDGAHNNESIDALVAVLKGFEPKNIKILFAAINTKPVNSMLERLKGAGEVTVTSFDYPSALKLSDYPSQYKQESDWTDWVFKIRQDKDTLYVITGSLYFISQVRKALLIQIKD